MSFPHFTVFNSSASVRNNSINAALENNIFAAWFSVSQTVGRAPLVGNRVVTGGARHTGGHFPFYALYGNVRSNLPESGARPRTRLESDCGVWQGRRTRGGCGCFNTHTFRDERVQHPHFFCSFSAVSHKRLTAVAPRFLWPPCVWECARCSCLLSPPSQT